MTNVYDFNNSLNNMRFSHLLGDNREIVIEEDVWIGHGTIMLKKTFIGEGTIVGANSLVNAVLKPYAVYVGNPARFIKPRFDTYDDLMKYINMMNREYNFKTRYTTQELSELYTYNK